MLTNAKLTTEAAPVELRGSLTVSYNTLVVAGQFVATIVCGAFSHTNQGWRWMLGLAGLPAALQFTGSQTLKRTPKHPKAPTGSIYCFSGVSQLQQTENF